MKASGWIRGLVATAALVIATATVLTDSICAKALELDDLTSYTGEIDPFTGEPVEVVTDYGTTTMESNRSSVADGVYYDRDTRMYVYPVGTGLSEISASVMDGMVVTGSVQINVPEGVVMELYRNGTQVEFQGNNLVRDTGEYRVVVGTESSTDTLFSFTLVGDKTGLITGYTMPAGFRITDATMNGDYVAWSRNYISLVDEGYYTITYECDRTEVVYNLNITIDHTAPVLTFDGVQEDGKARGAVTIGGVQEGDRITIYRDGVKSAVNSAKLTQSGRYEVIAVDDADNMSTYQFTIMIYVDSHGVLFFIFLLAVIAAVVAYLILKRKKLRIR
ncbi:MAG: hypothetical protein K6E92_01695 [Lachnospiraceae bacterium]|nr:hypothetical protein [Lachnospiraceae bacterium]